MYSLRSFHIVFILIAFVAADMFGAWAVWSHSQTPDRLKLVVGLLSFAFGFALVAYAIWLIRKFDRVKIE